MYFNVSCLLISGVFWCLMSLISGVFWCLMSFDIWCRLMSDMCNVTPCGSSIWRAASSQANYFPSVKFSKTLSQWHFHQMLFEHHRSLVFNGPSSFQRGLTANSTMIHCFGILTLVMLWEQMVMLTCGSGVVLTKNMVGVGWVDGDVDGRDASTSSTSTLIKGPQQFMVLWNY